MIIDLSMPVNEQSIVFPGDAKPKFEQAGTLETTNFVDHVIHINNHLGTHMDAPGHMVEGGKWLAAYEPGRFFCDAICIDARNQTRLTAALLDDVEIPKDGAVLFYTGSGDKYDKQEYAEDYPPVDEDLAKALIEKGIKMVGVDMISFDHDEPFPIHKALLANDILLLENLINLSSVVGKEFKLYAFPVKLELEAAPARVIAEVN